MNEQLLETSYVNYCETLLAIRKSREWSVWALTWEEYVTKRLSMSKTRAKLLCDVAKFRAMCRAELFTILPETPENVRPILSLPQKAWIEIWELVVSCATGPINAKHCEAVMQRFNVYSRKKIPPDVLAGMRLRRAAKTMAGFEDGEKVAGQVGKNGFGKIWDDAVRVTIDADQAKRNG